MWEKIKKWAKGSETIAFAKIQIVVGAIGTAIAFALPVVAGIDFSSWVPPTWMPAYLLLNGLLTKYLRERRADDL